ncbi:MAG: sensor histidine kinase [Leptolyngbya sp. IPPAS B-1204]|nr:MAG: sensor histidine kinase [Leptolyngbya sp. IPPAS B-1204]
MPNFKAQIFNLQNGLLANPSRRWFLITVLLLLGSGGSLKWWLAQHQVSSTRHLADEFNRQALALTDLYLDAYFAIWVGRQSQASQPKPSKPSISSSDRQQTASTQTLVAPIRQAIPPPTPQLTADLSHGLQQASKLGRLFIVATSGQIIASSSQASLLQNQTAMPIRADLLLQTTLHQLQAAQKAPTSPPLTNQSLEFQLNGERYFAQVTSWTNSFGLDWWLVTVVPETAFTTNFHPMSRILVLSLLALVPAACSFKRFVRLSASEPVTSPITAAGTKDCQSSEHSMPIQQALQQVLAEKLAEKEVLLKEVHHRVKNNLHIIANLLDLQSDRIQDPQLLSLFTDAQTRIQAIALIHEQLYQSDHAGQINFADYLRRLLDNIRLAADDPTHPIQSNLTAEPVLLNLETAVPCGLLINELVTNALKHAFPEQPGEIAITLFQVQDTIHILVQDDGIGLPADFDWRNSTSLGLKLVQILTRQLRATLTVDGNHGVRVELTFSPLKYKPRF